jgi:hypothetical protein
VTREMSRCLGKNCFDNTAADLRVSQERLLREETLIVLCRQPKHLIHFVLNPICSSSFDAIKRGSSVRLRQVILRKKDPNENLL